MSIPKKQKAQMITEYGLNLKYVDIDVPTPEPDEVLVNILYSGVCHTDVCFMENSLGTKDVNYTMVVGHEGAEIVEAKGDLVKSFNIGDKVGVKVGFVLISLNS